MSYIEVSHQDTKIVESDEVNELYWEFFMKTWISAVDGNVAVGRLYDECYGIVEESGGGGGYLTWERATPPECILKSRR